MADTITVKSPPLFLPPSDKSPVRGSKPAHARHPQAPLGKEPLKAAAADPNGVVKRKQTKSRNGCITCKAKRLKCDETKPTCQQCSRRSVACGGYKKDFKWRPFEDTTFATKTTGKPKKTSPPQHVSARDAPFACHVPPTYNTQPTIFYAPTQAPPALRPMYGLPSFPEPSQALMTAMFAVPQHQPYMIAPPAMSPVESFHPGSESTNSVFEAESADTRPSTTTLASSVSSGQSPRLVDLLLPGTDLNDLPEEYMSFREQHGAFYQPTGLTPPDDAMDKDIEEIPRDFDQHDWTLRLPSPAQSDPSTSSTDSLDMTLFARPRLSMTSPEMLTRRFDQETCGILSVKDGPTENPWRTLIWPLAHDSPALYHAMLSMTSFHQSRDSPALRIEGIDHMRTAVHALASGIENMRVDAAISTTIALAFSESWDQHISTGINHIKGARVLIDRALVQHSRNPVRGDELTRLKFLCNQWVYIDVIARLTSADPDESSDYDSVLDSLHMGESDACQLDPLMGCAQTLFPIIGRVANLVRKVRQMDNNSPTIISQAMELKRHLEDWMPPSYIENPEDETTSPHDAIKTATAYQYATLLYLHQAVPEIPSLPSAVLAQKVVRELATVDHRSRHSIVHIYPLTAAGCELVDPVDREWICDRWDKTAARMKIGIIERCLEVTKEVWSRRDTYAAEAALDQDISGSIYSATPSLKRHFSHSSDDFETAGDFCWLEPPAKARAVESVSSFDAEGDFCWLDPAPRESPRRVPVQSAMSGGMRRSEVMGTETLPYDFTVKGRLHWLGVMKDWNWEVLLG
ncbi:hypothetical protein DPSP01_010718 [Paraphaeosphaeria sporulosa]|uniref:Zn(2)-C6 fungal-type domain-containing protein n=1 Tax=Paraphaeosphaeria sporulosa TaxID=1460663 RepID=A0A177CHC4_9PLEO|nr:uncharacterized protein CC84DRAFT_1258195 [Paraphaeosphaeria sporulosa]OAG06975.1 hypothetical protein CC84DRAFT_1258195 [Paraphaeosphaeria sporulosa]